MMPWGGARPGAGRKKVEGPTKAKRTPFAPPKTASRETSGLIPSGGALARILAESRSRRTPVDNPFRINPNIQHPPQARPSKNLQLAMDSCVNWSAANWSGEILNNVYGEGLTFLGYPYLAELAQRPEYRVISETIATEMTRKWIKFAAVGDVDKTEKIKELVDFLDSLKIRDKFADLALYDGLMGRAHLYADSGADDAELMTPIADAAGKLLRGKVGRKFLQRLQTVEAVWTYPLAYNAINPLAADWYNPQVWYVLGKQIHGSRIPTFIGRPLPDMLKPAYSFGGLSLSQMAKPYVDIWLRTRESVGALIHAFSVMVLKTDLGTMLTPDGAGTLLARAALFNATRDNQGLMIINKDTEDFANVSASIAGLSDLQAQSQEHMMSVARIPAVKFTGIEPKGLNSTSEGTMRAFNDSIHAYQHKLFKPNLDYIIDIAMITLWGDPDKEITYEFESLVELTDKEKGELRKLDAETGQIQIDKGVISPEEERKRVVEDPDSLYQGLDPEDVPDLETEEESGLMPGGKAPPLATEEADNDNAGQPAREAGAQDANALPFGLDGKFSEGDHPRGQPQNAGQFSSSSGAGSRRSSVTSVLSEAEHHFSDPNRAATNEMVNSRIKKQGGKSLDDEEMAVARSYMGQGSKVINSALRGGSALSKEERDVVAIFDSALSKLPPYTGPATRAINADPSDVAKIIDALKPGSTVQFPTYSSATAGDKVASNFRGSPIEISIQSKGGARDFSGVSAYGKQEREVIFGRTTKFKVDSVKKVAGKYKVALTEVSARGANDAFNEADHPRGQPGNAGQFGSGGGGKSDKEGAKPARTAAGALKSSDLKKVGAQMGSNPGGVYEDKAGGKFYIKAGRSPEHVKTELAAADLYGLAGAPTLKYRPVEGGEHIATELSKLDKKLASQLSPAEVKEARRDFAAHAWLANWDAVGTGGDNLGTVAGVPTALDLGGALTYRAQGAPKGAAFGDKVGELDTLRSKSMNRDAAKIFGDITAKELRESTERVTNISDAKIRAAVKKNGLPDTLADKLIARRDDIGRRAALLEGDGPPNKRTSTVVFNEGEPPPVTELNGIPFAKWKPPKDWNEVEGQADLPEDNEQVVVPKGKSLSSGLLIREPDGRVWLMRPKGGFGGYEHSFPKGRKEQGLSLQANAIKEAYEETGLKAKITGFGGDHEGDMTVTRFYVAEREGGSPVDHGEESDGVVLAPPSRLGDFLNKARDQRIAKAHLAGDEFNPADHPHAPPGSPSGGQFVAKSGGAGGGEKDVGKPTDYEDFAAWEKAKAAAATPVFKSKKEHAAHLLTQEGGVTTAQMLAALKWPSISMPAMAKTLGMKLEKTKEGGVTKYKGVPLTASEKAEQPPPPTPGVPQPIVTHKNTFFGTEASVFPNSDGKQFNVVYKDSDSGQTIGIKIFGTQVKAEAEAKEFAEKGESEKPIEATHPPATAAELEKAKKSLPLKLEFVPGAPKTAAAQKLVDKFNADYAGKELTQKADLEKKVAAFKDMQAAMVPLMTAEQQKAAAAQAETLKKQAEAQAKIVAAAKAEAEAYAAKMADPKVKQSYEVLAAITGGSKGAQAYLQNAESRIKSAGLAGKIEPHEAAMIIAYSGSHYRGVNEQLRNGMLTPEQFKYTKALNKALDKLPEYDGISYRKADVPKEKLAKYKPGYIVPEEAFTSSSKNKGTWSGSTQYVIEGKGGRDITKLSSHAGEAEVLFKSGTHFMVTKVEGKEIHLKEME